MTRRLRSIGICAATTGSLLLAWSPAAAGQQPAATSEQARPPALVVERVENGFIVAPDFKITEVDETFAKQGGVYGGWVNDRTLLIGAGGYWLTNRSPVYSMAYGGLVVGWLARTDRRIGFGARGLVGVGEATLSDPLSELFRRPADRRGGQRSPFLDVVSGPSGARVIIREQFFIVEPQADLLVRLTDWLRLDWGVGYRAIGSAGNLDGRLRGVTGSVSLQIGTGF